MFLMHGERKEWVARQRAFFLKLCSQKMSPSQVCAPPAAVIDVSGSIGERYIPLVNDLLRTLVIQVTVQLLMSAVDGDPLWSGSFWLVLLYILIATVGYHLLFTHAVVVK